MLSWLLIIILAYFFFSLSYLGDKLILSGPPKANSYTFYVGVSSVLAIFLIPFAHITTPPMLVIFLAILDSIAYVFGLYTMFTAIEKFDVSRVMTTIGATQPIFILALTWIFWGAQQMSVMSILAFILLLVGSILISVEKNYKTTGIYLKITIISSLFFSLDYIFAKIIYLSQPFLQGFITMRLFIFLFTLLLLLSKNNRKEIFKKQNVLNKKNGIIFLSNQTFGGLANILQGFAISLAPIAFLPIVNSLRGIQYVFLFLITLCLSLSLPKVLKEEISKKIIIQKIISILLIGAGLALLFLN